MWIQLWYLLRRYRGGGRESTEAAAGKAATAKNGVVKAVASETGCGVASVGSDGKGTVEQVVMVKKD